MTNEPLELLAPAGSPEVLDAALASGATAVYFGLQKLNARRGATNFTAENLPDIVKKIHGAKAKAYLTLNIQLTNRELGLAFRTLQCASDTGVDAVLVTDPAFLAVRSYFPRLAFHFSTQAAIACSAGVRAAKSLDIQRVVLARECSREEIAAACRQGLEIEIFIQGAHCFSCSGRCLMSSWGGGRSGNRGACTSPCRVRWTNQQGVSANPLSMHDMSLLGDLAAVAETGVCSLKIEGRLKSAQWVSMAVSLYRRALDGAASPEELSAQSQALGNYTGRKLTDGYFQGQCSGLTGDDQGRTAQSCSGTAGTPEPVQDAGYLITVSKDDREAMIWEICHQGTSDSLRIPRQRIANPKRAVSIREILAAIPECFPKKDAENLTVTCQNDEIQDELLPKSCRNTILDFIATYLRNADKKDDGEVRNVTLPAGVREILEHVSRARCANNPLPLIGKATHVRMTLEQFLKPGFYSSSLPKILSVSPKSAAAAGQARRVIVENAQDIAAVALPDVIYEEDIPVLQDFLKRLPAGLAVEINGWDGWQLAKDAGHPMIGGAGLAVLNSLAASFLYSHGCEVVSVSPEIDREQLEELAKHAEVPLAITIYSHPQLMVTRAELPAGFSPEDRACFADARDIRVQAVRIGNMTQLRAVDPMDWRDIRNNIVHAARYIVDLCGSPVVPTETPSRNPNHFNYDRRLR